MLDAEYYNTGEASGYKHVSTIEKADEYVLVLKRDGNSEIRKTIGNEQVGKLNEFDIAS